MKTFDFKLDDFKDFGPKKFDPDKYILTEELNGAVKVATALNQPLLLTGEPGTGKTRLAFKIAYEMNNEDASFAHEPLTFYTKTTSTAQDLFYIYDALRHFHDANLMKAEGKEAPDATPYISLQALGEAIARTNPKELKRGRFVKGNPGSAVVLIDEIDKAPRDFSNDLLHEIEHNEFKIRELTSDKKITKGEGNRIIVVMTSNSEKNLPEAFLRRCVFYHIPFPGTAKLVEIAQTYFSEESAYANEFLIRHFNDIRAVAVRKPPATAEMIAWLHMLEVEDLLRDNGSFANLDEKQKKILEYSYAVLVKNKEDQAAVNDLLKKM